MRRHLGWHLMTRVTPRNIPRKLRRVPSFLYRRNKVSYRY